MYIISKFRLKLKKRNEYSVISFEDPICPCCDGQLRYIGSRKRKFIDEIGDRIILYIRRLRCTACNKIHHELPDILIPYKLYSKKIIQAILKETLSIEPPVDNQTIKRIIKWWCIFKYYTKCIHTNQIKDLVNSCAIFNTRY